jgi:ribonuclease G
MSLKKYVKQVRANRKKLAPFAKAQFVQFDEKQGNISTALEQGDEIIVQVTKEPISTKGPKVSGDISIAGRYLVLRPFGNTVSISQKIKKGEERSRLRRLMQSIRPQNFGVIVRTVAEGRSVAELDADLHQLMEAWSRMTEKLKRVNSPCKVHAELGTTTALLRDVLTDDFATIYVDSQELYSEVCQFLKSIEPGKEDIVKLYKMSTPIFDQFGISRDIRRAFGKIVTIRSGVYLYIEHTEAMHVIDVNSGNHIKAGTGQEDTALQVNIESAKEIARQLRLRDMGGIVIVDFIDMAKPEHRNDLYKLMRDLMATDRAKHNVLPLTKFGLMQLTRQRIRPVTEINTTEKCPLCHGTGRITSTVVIDEEVERKIADLVEKGQKTMTVRVSPILGAYLTRGWNSFLRKWKRKYKCKLDLVEMSDHSILQYEIVDENGKALE